MVVKRSCNAEGRACSLVYVTDPQLQVVGQVAAGKAYGWIDFAESFKASFPILQQVEVKFTKAKGYGFRWSQHPKFQLPPLTDPELDAAQCAQLQAAQWHDYRELGLPALLCRRHHTERGADYFLITISRADAHKATQLAGVPVARTVGLVLGPSNTGRVLFSTPFAQAYPVLTTVTVVHSCAKGYVYAPLKLHGRTYEEERARRHLPSNQRGQKRMLCGLAIGGAPIYKGDGDVRELMEDTEHLSATYLPPWLTERLGIWRYHGAYIASYDHVMTTARFQHDWSEIDREFPAWARDDYWGDDFVQELLYTEDQGYHIYATKNEHLPEPKIDPYKLKLKAELENGEAVDHVALWFHLSRQEGLVQRLNETFGAATALRLLDWAIECLSAPLRGRAALQQLKQAPFAPGQVSFISQLADHSYSCSELQTLLRLITPEQINACFEPQTKTMLAILVPSQREQPLTAGTHKAQVFYGTTAFLGCGPITQLRLNELTGSKALPQQAKLTWFIPSLELHRGSAPAVRGWSDERYCALIARCCSNEAQRKVVVQVNPRSRLYQLALDPSVCAAVLAGAELSSPAASPAAPPAGPSSASAPSSAAAVAPKSAAFLAPGLRSARDLLHWLNKSAVPNTLYTWLGPRHCTGHYWVELTPSGDLPDVARTALPSRRTPQYPNPPSYWALHVLCDHELRQILVAWYHLLVRRLCDPRHHRKHRLVSPELEQALREAHIISPTPNGPKRYRINEAALQREAYRNSILVFITNSPKLTRTKLERYYHQGQSLVLAQTMVQRYALNFGPEHQGGLKLLTLLIANLSAALERRLNEARQNQHGNNLLGLERYLHSSIDFLALMSSPWIYLIPTKNHTYYAFAIKAYFFVLLGLVAERECLEYRAINVRHLKFPHYHQYNQTMISPELRRSARQQAQQEKQAKQEQAAQQRQLKPQAAAAPKSAQAKTKLKPKPKPKSHQPVHLLSDQEISDYLSHDWNDEGTGQSFDYDFDLNDFLL